MSDDALIASGSFEFCATEIRVTGDPSFEEWEAVGEWLTTVRESIHWWIADWVNWGEQRFGERAAQGISARVNAAANATGWKPETIQQYARVGRQIPKERRREDVSFSHHRDVAHLPAEEQTAWLARAAREDLSTDRMRAELRAEKGDTTCWLLVCCRNPEDRETLKSRLVVEGRECKEP